MTSKDLNEKGLDAETPVYESYKEEEEEEHRQAPDEEEPISELADNYIGAEVLLPIGDKMVSGSVRRRKRDREGSVFGKANINPILDTRVYEVEFPDGSMSEFSANVIAENMWSQCDMEGN